MNDTRKIITKISRLLLDKLETKLESAFMKRDRFLSHTLGVEIEKLAKVKKKNAPSDKKKLSKIVFESTTNIIKYILNNEYDAIFTGIDEIKKINWSFVFTRYLGTKKDRLEYLLELHHQFRTVSLVLNKKVVDRIDEVCSNKNIPRDLFINRIIYFLTIENIVDEDDEQRSEYYYSRLEDKSIDLLDRYHRLITAFERNMEDYISEDLGFSRYFPAHNINTLDALSCFLADPLEVLGVLKTDKYDNSLLPLFPCFYSDDYKYLLEIDTHIELKKKEEREKQKIAEAKIQQKIQQRRKNAINKTH